MCLVFLSHAHAFQCLVFQLPSIRGFSSYKKSKKGEKHVRKLTVDYYKRTCPHAESILRQVMVQKIREAPTTAGATLRLLFHDCFVDGCDASVLVSSTPGNKAERDEEINHSLAGDAFDAVHRAKAAVEKICPGVVSCADVLAIITRDLVQLVGGPFWEVRKGRKDGRLSMASRVGRNLPTSTASINELTRLFASKGLNEIDLIALSGAHTIGFAHCTEFTNRIYNFNGTRAGDPSMNPSFLGELRRACPPRNGNPDVVASMDAATPFQFDNSYYRSMQRGLGLLTSDQELLTNARTRSVVDAFASSQDLFYEVFAASMDKLGNVGVKNETNGVVRKECHRT
ncbi:peroxidase 51 isoform X4 [Selaginella moellendorffii]|uniref:peroxidase 51 isoform X4 n=1 Tax=Selaginella moellendorffii TaxID=88036 RepID=UPI000D1C5DA4|nr:peroxidase 51 isoform X4 [Selaginella moellendorffii]|eukprot:XP_024520578.1 peroxidase 51 isoform X4 [Selaginella moellendorffii]